MFKNYFYVSEGVVKAFPNLKKSNPFDGPFGLMAHVAIIEDYSKIEKFCSENEDNEETLFAYEIVDSLVDLEYDAIDYDDEDNEQEVSKTLNIEVCREWGLITAIEQELGITKEQNVAYVLFKLSNKYHVNPIELIHLIQSI